MARKESARRQTRPAPPAGPSRSRKAAAALRRRLARVAAAVSSLRRRKSRSVGAQAASASSKRMPPIQRRSVVRKPARGPSVRAAAKGKRPAASTARPAPLSAASLSMPAAAATPSSAAGHWGAAARPAGTDAPFSIPSGYGDDRIVLMVKDPWWVFAYWEVQPETERAARGQLLPQEVAGLQSVLRLYDVTDAEEGLRPVADLSLSGLATNWYIQTNAPGRSFIVELGLLANSGRFLPMVRSNPVTTPRFGPSDVIDPEWAASDDLFWKLVGTMPGIGVGASPTSWHALTVPSLFSGTVVGQPPRPSIVRGFWCRVNTDLVIHGVTEPKATVRIQGVPVAVRKDGSFSLRVALPEGTQTVTIEATSADGRHAKTVTPLITFGWAGAAAPLTGSPEERNVPSRPVPRRDEEAS